MDPEQRQKRTAEILDWAESQAAGNEDPPEGMIAEDDFFRHRHLPKYGPEANEALDAVCLRRDGERFPRQLHAHALLLDPDHAVRWGMLLLSHGTLGFGLRIGMGLSDALKIAADYSYPFDALIASATITLFDVIALQQQIKAGTLILTVRSGDDEHQVKETIARAESHGIFNRVLKLPAPIKDIVSAIEEGARNNAQRKSRSVSPNEGSSVVATPPSDVHKSPTRKVKREERLKRAEEAINVLAEEFIAHSSTFDWLAEKMPGRCRAIADELAARALTPIEIANRRLAEQIRLQHRHGATQEASSTPETTEASSPQPPAKSKKRQRTNKEILQAQAVRDEFARRLRDAREKKGMSTSELAAAAGMHQPSITRYEKARRLPHPDQLARLATALGIAPMDLLPENWKKPRKS
jgi:ribosome-binding protein aMBF1 (putative translation factor)